MIKIIQYQAIKSNYIIIISIHNIIAIIILIILLILPIHNIQTLPILLIIIMNMPIWNNKEIMKYLIIDNQ